MRSALLIREGNVIAAIIPIIPSVKSTSAKVNDTYFLYRKLNLYNNSNPLRSVFLDAPPPGIQA